MKTRKVGKQKYNIGDTVEVKKYGKGKIVKVEKLFKEVNSLQPNVRLEGDIKGIQVPYRYDGETLEIDYPEMDLGSCIVKARTGIYKFYTYCYSIRLEGQTHLTALRQTLIKSKIK